MVFDISFYKNKKVLLTGHTGFKGAWMCKVLEMAGADVLGYSLEPPTSPSLFKLSGLNHSDKVKTVIGDVREIHRLMGIFDEFQPEIVIHMAAQPIVLESYKDPISTYDINVMGTVNLLECVRTHSSVKSFVNVTTDKVYLNREWDRGYREDDELNGFDPYSNSKSCSELVTSSYRNSFFGGEKHCREDGKPIAISTMRAGNVIGGGDFAVDRIIPDCIRAVEKGETIVVRNPYSTRPYQHVLEPVMAYLMVAAGQYEDVRLAGSYNVGPDDEGCYSTSNIVDLFCKCWNDISCDGGHHISWKSMVEDNAPHEATFLKLDCTKIKKVFDWTPKWSLEIAMNKIVEWTIVYFNNRDSNEIISSFMKRQISEFIGLVDIN